MSKIIVPETLVSQQAELNLNLAATDAEIAKLIGLRSEIEASLQMISNAILILSGEELPMTAPTVSGRKPMSEESKRKISEGLKKSHIRKQFDITGSVPQIVLEEPAPSEQPVAAEPSGRSRKSR